MDPLPVHPTTRKPLPIHPRSVPSLPAQADITERQFQTGYFCLEIDKGSAFSLHDWLKRMFPNDFIVKRFKITLASIPRPVVAPDERAFLSPIVIRPNMISEFRYVRSQFGRTRLIAMINHHDVAERMMQLHKENNMRPQFPPHLTLVTDPGRCVSSDMIPRPCFDICSSREIVSEMPRGGGY